MIIVEWTVEKELIKQQATFITTWSPVVIQETWWDKIHHNFKEGMWAHPLGYKGVNLGWPTNLDKQA